jgi:predicted ATPase with chaperone activity
MAIIKAPPKQPKSVTIQARVEESVKMQLDQYAKFIDSTPSYVITEALKVLFKRDDEFKSWLGQHTYNSEAQHPSSKVAVSKGESVQLALK